MEETPALETATAYQALRLGAHLITRTPILTLMETTGTLHITHADTAGHFRHVLTKSTAFLLLK